MLIVSLLDFNRCNLMSGLNWAHPSAKSLGRRELEAPEFLLVKVDAYRVESANFFVHRVHDFSQLYWLWLDGP